MQDIRMHDVRHADQGLADRDLFAPPDDPYTPLWKSRNCPMVLSFTGIRVMTTWNGTTSLSTTSTTVDPLLRQDAIGAGTVVVEGSDIVRIEYGMPVIIMVGRVANQGSCLWECSVRVTRIPSRTIPGGKM